MNFPGQQIYATFDRSYQIHNSNSVDYLQSVGQITNSPTNNDTDNYNQQLLTNLFPLQTSDSTSYLPVYDPNCQTYLNHLNQLQQPLNGPIYPLSNNAISYQFGYPADNSYVGLQNPYVTNPEFYRNLLNYNQTRQFSSQLNYQTNQVAVLNNIQLNSTPETFPNQLDTPIVKIDNSTKSIDNNVNSYDNTRNSNFRNSQDGGYKRNFKSFRNKTKSSITKQNQTSNLNEIINRNSKQNFMPNSNTNIDEYNETNITNGQNVELIVTNLDYNISAKEWKKLLYNQFQNVIKRIVNVYVQTHTDGSNCAIVKLNSLEDARLAISQFHRKKIGYKRIQVNLLNNTANTAPTNVKQEVASLLKSIAGYSLTVFKFMELYEKRYHKSISVLELYKMRDFIEIKDVGGNQNGKIISLTNAGISYVTQSDLIVENSQIYEAPVCQLHCNEDSDEYLSIIDCAILPNVKISLNLFKKQVYDILQLHNNSMPLLSFIQCYKTKFNDLEILNETNMIIYQNDGNNLNDCNDNDADINIELNTTKTIIDDNKLLNNNVEVKNEGVPLEHLLLCIPNVKIITSIGGVRKLVLDEKRDLSNKPFMDNNSLGGHLQISGLGGVLIDRLHQFSREIVDLMKHQPNCRMLLSKFIPTYHHHFGKQCRVADYGFSKLHELIDALPHVVHVIGSGYVRQLYLSYKVQLRRFTNELTKVLKSQSTKSCLLNDYSNQYKLLFHKDFNIIDYGVCFIEDLINEIPENTIEIIYDNDDNNNDDNNADNDGDVKYNDDDNNNKIINNDSNNIILTMPKRIQTNEEREKTAQFAIEIVDLLKQSLRCRLAFNKFIPSYHHHFSRQCKVAEYGFSKLIELLDAVPQAVQVIEDHGEKYVVLTNYELLKVFAEQTLSILEKSPDKYLKLSDFCNIYSKLYGYTLNIDDYGVNSIIELFSKIPKIAKLQNNTTIKLENIDETIYSELYVCLADRIHIKYIAQKILLILLDVPNCILSNQHFVDKYYLKFRENPDFDIIQKELSDIVMTISTDRNVSDSSLTGSNESGQLFFVQLTPIIKLSKEIREILRINQGKLSIVQLENSYEQKYGYTIQPSQYGYPSLFSLLQASSYAVSIKGRGTRATVLLIQDFIGKLAYKVAYSTEPVTTTTTTTLSSSNEFVNTDSISIEQTNTEFIPTSPQKQIQEIYDNQQDTICSTTQYNGPTAMTITIPTYQPTSTQASCFIQPTPLYNPNIYAQGNYLSATLNSYPHPYFNSPSRTTPIFNPWLHNPTTNWYHLNSTKHNRLHGQNRNATPYTPTTTLQQQSTQPTTPYQAYTTQQTLYQTTPDYNIIATPNQTTNNPTTAIQQFPTTCPTGPLSYITATQDQKQIDELVETLAYDNTSTMAASPISSNHLIDTTGATTTNPLLTQQHTPWFNYAFQHQQKNHKQITSFIPLTTHQPLLPQSPQQSVQQLISNNKQQYTNNITINTTIGDTTPSTIITTTTPTPTETNTAEQNNNENFNTNNNNVISFLPII